MENRSVLGRGLLAFLLAAFVLQTFAFAAVPQVVSDYINVFVDLAKGNMGIIFIVIILGFSAFLAWRNGNLTPLLWGAAAAVLIGAAPYMAPKFIDFGSTTFGG